MPNVVWHYGVPAGALLVFVGELGVPTVVSAEATLLFVGSHSVHSPLVLVAAFIVVSVADVLGASTFQLAARRTSGRLRAVFPENLVAGSADVVARWRDRVGDREAAAVLWEGIPLAARTGTRLPFGPSRATTSRPRSDWG